MPRQAGVLSRVIVLAPITDRPSRQTLGSVAAATTLARHVAYWRAHQTYYPYSVSPLDGLRPALLDFCREMHAAGVHGPSVRHLVASTLTTALRGMSHDARDVVIRESQSAVDVIYLLGQHRSPTDAPAPIADASMADASMADAPMADAPTLDGA